MRRPIGYMPLDKGHAAMADERVCLGIGVKVPALADWSVQAVRDAFAPLEQETREKIGAAGKALVDGLGVQRFLLVLKENGIIH